MYARTRTGLEPFQVWDYALLACGAHVLLFTPILDIISKPLRIFFEMGQCEKLCVYLR